ncbi:MAG: hypothetical protein QXM31_04325 [Candidatus Woesearchaeota archaeon]
MYYIVELGWGKKAKGFYSSHCYAGVKDEFNGTYRIFGIQYLARPGTQWWLKSGSLWQTKNPDGKITGLLKKGKKVMLNHRSVASLDKMVKAMVLSVREAEIPEKLTSPLARISPGEKDRF